MHSRIAGTGSYLPAKRLTNAELENMIDTSDEWIVSRTGIEARHIVGDEQTTSELAERAARPAIEAAGLTVDDIDLIIVATTTPELTFPSTACLLQQRLGIHGSPAFDIQAVCTGFVYALDLADRYVRTGGASNVLVVGVEIFSRILDWQDRSTCILFGDGAGAVVLSASDEPGLLSSRIHADGQYKKLLYVPVGPASPESVKLNESALVQMQGNEVFKFAVSTLGKIVEEILADNDMQKHEVDWLVPHQANVRIISATAKKLNMPMDKVVVTIAEHGNTSAASIPLALDKAVRDGRIQRGQTLLFEAFGGGFTWGANLLKY